MNAALQMFLPQWVRGRGLSVYQMVLFGGQAAGAAVWGVVAETAGLVPSLLVAALVMAAGAATVVVWPFHDIEHLDRSLVRWPEPELLNDPDPGDGPILVEITYTVAADKEREFPQSMALLKESGCEPGAPDGVSTGTRKVHASSSRPSACPAGTSTSGSIGSDRQPPTSTFTTPPSRCPTRRRRRSTTSPSTSIPDRVSTAAGVGEEVLAALFRELDSLPAPLLIVLGDFQGRHHRRSVQAGSSPDAAFASAPPKPADVPQTKPVDAESQAPAPPDRWIEECP